MIPPVPVDRPRPAAPAPPAVAPAESPIDFALRRYARTFTGLPFAGCAVAAQGTTATAVCRTADDARTWDVELSRQGDGWMIESAVARLGALDAR